VEKSVLSFFTPIEWNSYFSQSGSKERREIKERCSHAAWKLVVRLYTSGCACARIGQELARCAGSSPAAQHKKRTIQIKVTPLSTRSTTLLPAILFADPTPADSIIAFCSSAVNGRAQLERREWDVLDERGEMRTLISGLPRKKPKSIFFGVEVLFNIEKATCAIALISTSFCDRVQKMINIFSLFCLQELNKDKYLFICCLMPYLELT